MIKRPENFEVGDLILTSSRGYWDDTHYNQIVCIIQIDWGLELLAVSHQTLEFNYDGIPYHQFKHFKLVSKKSKLSELVFS